MTITGRAAVQPAHAVAVPARGRVMDVLVGLALIVLVVGTFLPWLRSGTTTRNSYSADGAIKHLIMRQGYTSAVLTAWPVLCLLATIALAALIIGSTGSIGFARTGAALAAVCAVAAGAVGVRVLHAGSNSVLGVAPIGPGVTLAGSAAILAVLVFSLLRAAVAGGSPTHRSRRIR